MAVFWLFSVGSWFAYRFFCYIYQPFVYYMFSLAFCVLFRFPQRYVFLAGFLLVGHLKCFPLCGFCSLLFGLFLQNWGAVLYDFVFGGRGFWKLLVEMTNFLQPL